MHKQWKLTKNKINLKSWYISHLQKINSYLHQLIQWKLFLLKLISNPSNNNTEKKNKLNNQLHRNQTKKAWNLQEILMQNLHAHTVNQWPNKVLSKMWNNRYLIKVRVKRKMLIILHLIKSQQLQQQAAIEKAILKLMMTKHQKFLSKQKTLFRSWSKQKKSKK